MEEYPSTLWDTDLPAWVGVVQRVRGRLAAGLPVLARIGEHNGVPEGTVVPVHWCRPTDLYTPRNFDGSPVNPDYVPGYSLDSPDGAWGHVGWSGGGFYNPHTILFPDLVFQEDQ